MPTKAQKLVAEAKAKQATELHLDDKAISAFTECPELPTLTGLTRLSLAHNKIKSLPPSISNLKNLTHLTLFNNHLQDLPSTLTQLENLISLNLGMNRLSTLPRQFKFDNLQILDLSYNNLTEHSLPESLFENKNLRALYLSDNDLEHLPNGLSKLSYKLEVLTLRGNDLVEIPNFIGDFVNLKELILSQNRLIVLPPEFSYLKQFKEKSRNAELTTLELEGNHFVPPLMHKLGDITGLLDYITDGAYVGLYSKNQQLNPTPPAKRDKSKKISRRAGK